ncbi:inorganic pyrophosphatase/exopolyphosphatase-like protein [Encephalitozoon romaleae SJ-2008]|uniref:Inorganic pyrophosphatase/exopolyphosphatase-like protein n=1 Tax=Encephalitozoon romaleae (strain SJ-2008) TaxID=1178016 RepID=I6ZIC9_ENCRO|nr:inorganic pyrophosphatase/exopolyphosphatase-like protein [Encephalitozoon romaleae SJ-2008]AFN82978.1 inorganic pyrophosphatase/exopolyphosphatase-like protein [Encephalitozoon romaleae SJ-2008]
MALLKEKLKLFFEVNKEKIHCEEVLVAMGNEACDLDSFISSLVVAYAEGAVHVVNMRKEVFVAKGEIMWVCKEFGIDVDDLIFLVKPTLHFSSKARKIGAYFDSGEKEYPVCGKKIKLLLTDHNQPAEELEDCEIELIIDHHMVERSVSPAKRIYIDLDVGSATTLVSKYLGEDLARKNHSLPSFTKSQKDKETLCSAFAKLLLIPILMDTGFLKKRTSVFDMAEYRRLKRLADVKKKKLKGIIRALKNARKNDSGQETGLILQKDFKTFHYRDFFFGGSTVKYPFEDWADREGRNISRIPEEKAGIALMVEIESFRKAMGLDFFFVATKAKGSRNIIFANFPFARQIAAKNQMKSIDYKGLEYYSASKNLTRKLLVPEIIKAIDGYTHGPNKNKDL